MDRDDLYKIVSHSNLTTSQTDQLLNDQIYQQKKDWQKFLNLAFIALGLGFTVAGIVFFFAYNWDDLPKFVKLGLTELLLIVATVIALMPKFPSLIRNMVLTGAAMLVGVLFAVFGQIYQTGANAYDFFLAWTLFVVLWVVVSNFAPLWLLFLTLVNTTFILYTQQVARDWDEIFIVTLLFVFNALALILAITLPKLTQKEKMPMWFLYTLALAAVAFATLGISMGIADDDFSSSLSILIMISAGLYTLGLRYGSMTQNIFYPAIIAFSLIVILSVWLVDISNGAGMFLLVSLFNVISISVVIKVLLDLKKKWNHDQ
jgi:uncharacterized membrane protein